METLYYIWGKVVWKPQSSLQDLNPWLKAVTLAKTPHSKTHDHVKNCTRTNDAQLESIQASGGSRGGGQWGKLPRYVEEVTLNKLIVHYSFEVHIIYQILYRRLLLIWHVNDFRDAGILW